MDSGLSPEPRLEKEKTSSKSGIAVQGGGGENA